ncbi:amidase [Amycolatopsis anabasis]|uniref:amidase n=1 Tax=Amycolatopsis anabasis TaxID=1840409 RepID=UPI001C550CFA|nr:amidase [Amycolatopsis anabasis]
MNIPEILTFGAAEAARRLRAREVSSTELVRAVLARIEAVNPRVNAIRVVLAEEALKAAVDADRRLAAGKPAGPLDGVPVTVKENIDVAGTATTQGVAALAEEIAPVDAPPIANLRRNGAIPIARTNLPDFALRWHTDSGIAGPTRNPWDPELTPGGSSGGEAVSLATGMSLLGVGNDLGGSLRWPSQCAGTAALRPTLGRIPHALSLEPSTKPMSLQLIEVQGPMARRIEDLRLALEVMAAADPRDPWHSPVPASYAPERPRRVHVLAELPGVRIDPSVREAIRRGADALAAQGYQIREEPPPGIGEAAATWARLMTSDARRAWPDLDPVVSASGRRFMESMFELVPRIGLDEYAELFTTRLRLARAWAEYQRETPLVLAPIFAGRAFRAGSDLEGVAAAGEIVAGLRATVAVNLLGLPAVAVPVGLVDGLPQAVQLVGPRFGEELCLRAAEAIEAAWPTPTPIDPGDHRD